MPSSLIIFSFSLSSNQKQPMNSIKQAVGFVSISNSVSRLLNRESVTGSNSEQEYSSSNYSSNENISGQSNRQPKPPPKRSDSHYFETTVHADDGRC